VGSSTLPGPLSLPWVAALPASCFTASLFPWLSGVLGGMWRKEIFSAGRGRELFYLRYWSFTGQNISWMKVVNELQVWANGNFREHVIWGANNLRGEAHACENRGRKTVQALADERTGSFFPFASRHKQRRQPPPICWAQQHRSASQWEVAASSQGTSFPESRHIHTLQLVLAQGQQLPSVFRFVLVLLAPNIKMKGLDCQEGLLAFTEKNSASYRL